MDTLYGEMKRRSSQRLEVNARFGFLTKIEFLMDSTSRTRTSIRQSTYTRYYLRRHLCSRVEERGPSCAASHHKLRDANRRDSGALECARPGWVGTEVGTRDIVPELAHIVEDIPNHVCECAIMREKFLKNNCYMFVTITTDYMLMKLIEFEWRNFNLSLQYSFWGMELKDKKCKSVKLVYIWF